MKRSLFALLLVLAGCGAGEAPPGAVKTAPVVPAPSAAVTSAVLGDEAIDSDDDGKIDTWRTIEPDGVIVESRDTDGDGKADTTQRFEPVEEAPPGIGIELEEKR